jgi:hypothetical protein
MTVIVLDKSTWPCTKVCARIASCQPTKVLDRGRCVPSKRESSGEASATCSQQHLLPTRNQQLQQWERIRFISVWSSSVTSTPVSCSNASIAIAGGIMEGLVEKSFDSDHGLRRVPGGSGSGSGSSRELQPAGSSTILHINQSIPT